EMTSDPTELGFIRGIDGSARLESILDAAPIARDKARLLLVALSEAGMTTPADAPLRRKSTGSTTGSTAAPTPPPARTGAAPRTRTPPEPDTPADLGPTPGPVLGAAPSSVPLGTGQLAMVAHTVRSQDHFWALGVDRGSTSEQIDRAYEALA